MGLDSVSLDNSGLFSFSPVWGLLSVLGERLSPWYLQSEAHRAPTWKCHGWCSSLAGIGSPVTPCWCLLTSALTGPADARGVAIRPLVPSCSFMQPFVPHFPTYPFLNPLLLFLNIIEFNPNHGADGRFLITSIFTKLTFAFCFSGLFWGHTPAEKTHKDTLERGARFWGKIPKCAKLKNPSGEYAFPQDESE